VASSAFRFFDERFVKIRLASFSIHRWGCNPLLPFSALDGRRDLRARIIVGKGSIADSPLFLLDRIVPPFEGSLPTGDFEIGEFSPLLECLGESPCL